ncbi:MAG: 3D domain-containing protein [Filifactoraceae bacterium]
MKKIISFMLLTTLIATSSLGTVNAEPTMSSLNKMAIAWEERSIISKENWILEYDKPVKRIEFANFINNLMKLQCKTSSNYSDLSSEHLDSMLKVEKANLLVAVDNKMNPLNPMTREDAVVVFAKAIGMKVDFGQMDSGYTDNSKIISSAIPYIRAMKDMGNLPFGSEFNPNQAITKEEFLTMANLSISDIYKEGKVYSEAIDGSLIINDSNVNLKNVTINKNLIIAEGASSGTINLENINVKGQTIIRGGKTINIVDSSLDTILVENRDNTSLITLNEKTKASALKVVKSNGELTIQGNIPNVNLWNSGENFNLASGKVDRIEISEDVKVSIDKNSKVNIVNLIGTNSKVEISGMAESVYAGEKANKTNISVLEGGIITTLTKRTDSIVDSHGTITNTVELPAYIPPQVKQTPEVKANPEKTTNVSSKGEILLGTFSSTAYCTENYHHICNNGTPSRTASGTAPIPYKTIAVDPRVIKLGTKLKIQDSSGKIYYVTATDTGGAIKGKKIDMVVDTHKNALNWGRRSVKIWKIS